MKPKSQKSKPTPQTVEQARLVVATADAGVRETKEKARAAKSALKAARKASKNADKAAKKARKQARRARKTVKTLLARQAKLKKRTVSKRGFTAKKTPAPPAVKMPVDATAAEILGEHR